METDEVAHHHVVALAFQRLGRDPARLTSTQVLAGGISGSGVYSLRWAGEDLVLKVSHPGSRGGVLARARREAHFYQRLAAHVPLRVPDVVALSDDASGVAILLRAYLPPLPAHLWTEEGSLAVASELAHLHAVRLDDAGIRPQLRWLRWRRTPPLATLRAQAMPRWKQLAHHDSHSGVFTASRLRAVQTAIEHAEELSAAVRALPVVLCHGDCHRENLLRIGDGQFVWADWQEVHLGPGMMDLIFFTERAFFDGSQLPYDDMLQVYRYQLAEDEGPHVPLATLRRAATSAELLSWLFDWPPFLLKASPDRLARVLERVQDLVGRLDNVL